MRFLVYSYVFTSVERSVGFLLHFVLGSSGCGLCSQELHAKFSKAPGVDLHTLPASLVEQFCSGAIVSPAASAGGKFSPAAIIPPSLWAALMAFQKTGVEYAVSHNGRVLFGDEMVGDWIV